MGKNKGKNLDRRDTTPLPQDYDLIHSLTAIRKGGKVALDKNESTKTDIRIGSVNFNVWTNTESDTETEPQITGQVVTEQYVQSIVNNLKANQTANSNKLIEQFNGKYEIQEGKIEALKEKSLFKSGFVTWIGIVVSVISIIAGFVIYVIQNNNSKLDKVSNSLEIETQRIEKTEQRIDILEKVLLATYSKPKNKLEEVK